MRETESGFDRRQIMKKLMLVAALSCSAGFAHAGEGYGDPSDYRTPGVTSPSSSTKLQMRDSDPFSLKEPGVTYQGSSVKLQMRDADPFSLRTPGVAAVPAQDPNRTTLLTGRSEQNQQSRQSN